MIIDWIFSSYFTIAFAKQFHVLVLSNHLSWSCTRLIQTDTRFDVLISKDYWNPLSYGLDVNLDRVEDVLLHQKLLARAKDPDNRPVFHIRFLENICTMGDDDDEQVSSVPHASNLRGTVDDEDDHAKSLNHRKNSNGISTENPAEDLTKRKEALRTPIHEVIFSTVDKPKLLSQLSALLSDIGLNIREAHVFSTTDGYSLDVFVVDVWPDEGTESLYEATIKAIARSEVINMDYACLL